MQESSVNTQPLTPTELVRFSLRSSDLVNRTRALASSDKINLTVLANETGISYSWLRRFSEGKAKNVDIETLCQLYLALVGEQPGR